MVWFIYFVIVLIIGVTVIRFIEGNEYIFRVRVENKIGIGFLTESKSVIVKIKYDRFGRFDFLEVIKVSKEEMIVVWILFEYDGGKFIIGYFLEKKEKYGIRWVFVNKSVIFERRLKV